MWMFLTYQHTQICHCERSEAIARKYIAYLHQEIASYPAMTWFLAVLLDLRSFKTAKPFTRADLRSFKNFVSL
jgi:hypothetical protein